MGRIATGWQVVTVGPGIVPYSGSLDQVMTALKALALSPAMATEIANYKATLAAQSQTLIIKDANAANVTINIGPIDGTTSQGLSYIANQFAQVTITAMQKILSPAPILELVGRPGRVQQSVHGPRFIDSAVDGEIYTIDAYTWASTSDDPRRCQLEAMALSYCFKSLIKRNEQLNGLVQLIQPLGPVEALGNIPPAVSGSNMMSSACRFEVYVLTP